MCMRGPRYIIKIHIVIQYISIYIVFSLHHFNRNDFFYMKEKYIYLYVYIYTLEMQRNKSFGT